MRVLLDEVDAGEATRVRGVLAAAGIDAEVVTGDGADSQRRFREIADHIAEVFWITDPAKNAMLYISPAYEAIWGRTCASLYANPPAWIDAIHPEDRAMTIEALPRQIHGDYDVHYRILRPDGEVRWIHDRAFCARRADGTVERIVGVANDVTQERELEAQLRQAQKLEGLGQLAGGVAHDFNNLLSIILGNVDLLGMDLTPAEVAESVGEIEHAAHRAAALTRQLLVFSRRQAARLEVIDLNEVVGNVTRMLGRMLGELVVVRVQLSARPLNIRGDAGMIEQVLMNLAVNARDAMPRGGELLIETMPVAQRALLRVVDTGTGIPEAIQARIFDPFFTTKEPGKGTGLGLATSYSIVQQHQGQIALHSVPGHGTTFEVTLPLAHSKVTRSVTSPMEVMRGDECVLLVEDDPAVRSTGTKVLRQLGYRVLEADTGDRAVEVWRAHREDIALVITDLVLPGGMTGFELARRLLAEAPTVKVLFTSGYSAELAGAAGGDLERAQFLPKPFAIAQLAATVRGALDDLG